MSSSDIFPWKKTIGYSGSVLLDKAPLVLVTRKSHSRILILPTTLGPAYEFDSEHEYPAGTSSASCAKELREDKRSKALGLAFERSKISQQVFKEL